MKKLILSLFVLCFFFPLNSNSQEINNVISGPVSIQYSGQKIKLTGKNYSLVLLVSESTLFDVYQGNIGKGNATLTLGKQNDKTLLASNNNKKKSQVNDDWQKRALYKVDAP